MTTPPPAPPRRDLPLARPAVPAPPPPAPIASPIVSRTQTKLWERVEAHKLAALYLRNLAAGEYSFRRLKEGFDDEVVELGIDPKSVTDKRFAMWLKEMGCKRRRIHRQNWTMYLVPGGGAATRLAA